MGIAASKQQRRIALQTTLNENLPHSHIAERNQNIYSEQQFSELLFGRQRETVQLPRQPGTEGRALPSHPSKTRTH